MANQYQTEDGYIIESGAAREYQIPGSYILEGTSSLIKSLNGLAIASIKSRNGLAWASIKSINGLANI